MKRPAKGDRWQNRKTSRVCVVEELRGGPDAAHASIGYRYEWSASGRSRRQWTSLPYFNVAFSEYDSSDRPGQDRRLMESMADLEAELTRIRPVYEAACVWRAWRGEQAIDMTEVDLVAAIERAGEGR